MVLERERLLLAILGNRNSGKSHTWNTLFGRTVRTGRELKRLDLTQSRYVEVFLVSGSPQERKLYIEDIIGAQDPRIVLCSIQYAQNAIRTIDWFDSHGFSLFVHWLNPGYSDRAFLIDGLGLSHRILASPSLLGIRDGRSDASGRVREMKDFLYGWARSRGLLLRA